VFALAGSTIGKKVIMAVTGLVWIGYLVVHMYGNLKIFQGAVYFNEYADGLRSLGSPIFGHTHLLWVARLGLVVTLALHIWAAVSLYRIALKARPKGYAVYKPVQANAASLTIRYGGLAIFLFVLFHLAHLTWGIPYVHRSFIHGDAYNNVVNGFRWWPLVIIYTLSMIALGLHLYHGTWSMFQTLGMNNKMYDRPIRILALALALLIPIGFMSVPFAVLFGIVG
jgi:succinate dehydrogenase / fumarate reductase cytochrome b subunit